MKKIVLSLVFCISLIISLSFYFVKNKGVRKIFIFPSNSGNILEDRRIPSNKNYDSYVKELLLGPTQERGLPIFEKGTRPKNCILKKGTLYVDLTAEAMQSDFKKMGFKARKKLMEKNLKKNFASIRHLVIFVEGKECLET